MSENEYKSLQYLAGFILHKLYSKFLYSTTKQNTYQQYTSILQSCIVESDDTQTLIVARDRGGIWRVNKRIEKVFLGAELLFRSKSSSFITKLICQDIIKEILQDCSVLSHYNETCLDTYMDIDQHDTRQL